MGDTLPNLSKAWDLKDKATTPVPWSELSDIQQLWVDYNVVQGLITEADGEMHKMTVSDFAGKVGVTRQTLNNWTKAIPNFWDLVSERRKFIFNGARTQKVWNSLFLNATAKMNVRAQELWLLNNDKNFKLPSSKVEVEAGNSWAALMQARRQPAKTDEPIEGEIIE